MARLQRGDGTGRRRCCARDSHLGRRAGSRAGDRCPGDGRHGRARRDGRSRGAAPRRADLGARVAGGLGRPGAEQEAGARRKGRQGQEPGRRRRLRHPAPRAGRLPAHRRRQRHRLRVRRRRHPDRLRQRHPPVRVEHGPPARREREVHHRQVAADAAELPLGHRHPRPERRQAAGQPGGLLRVDHQPGLLRPGQRLDRRPCRRASPGTPTQYFQYNEREARIRELTRIAWKPPWDIMVATTYRYDSPGIYGNSKLATDAANHVLHGTNPGSLAVLGLGLVYDTRDNEFFPHRGSYHQIGMRAVQGLPHQREHRVRRLRGDGRPLRAAQQHHRLRLPRRGRRRVRARAAARPVHRRSVPDLRDDRRIGRGARRAGRPLLRAAQGARQRGAPLALHPLHLAEAALPHGRQPALRRRAASGRTTPSPTRRTAPASA